MKSRALTFFLLSACHGNAPSAPPATSSETAHEHEAVHDLPRHVTLSKQVQKEAGIEVGVVSKTRFAATLTLPGEIVADPNKLARISSPAVGRVERVAVNEGEQVQKGAVIAVLKVPELGKVRSGHASATAKAKAARTNADRLRALADQQLGSKQAALDADAEASALESEATAAQEQMAGMGVGEGAGYELVLRSPIAGIVTARNAVVGQPVSAQEVLATVAQLDEVWFAARVFEKDLGDVRQGAATSVQLNAFPKERFSGRVDYVGKQVDPIARTLTARIRLQNERGLLRLGLFGNALVERVADDLTPTITIADSALTDIGGQPFVFVEQADGDFMRHDVVLGRQGVGQVEITNGLHEGERIVVRGVFTLKSVLIKPSGDEP